MATQQELETELAAIERQLNTGITRVSYEGKGSIDRDLSALRTRAADLRSQIAGMTAERPMTRRVLTYSSKGY